MKNLPMMLIGAASACLTMPAAAQVSNVVYTISASSSLGSASLSFTQSDAEVTDNGDGSYTLSFSGATDLVDAGTGNVIATLTGATALLDPGGSGVDPRVNLGFSLENGDAASEISVTSGTTTFVPPFPSGQAFAAGSVTLTTGNDSMVMADGLIDDEFFYGGYTDLSSAGNPDFPFSNAAALLLPNTVQTSSSDVQSDVFPMSPIGGPFDTIASTFEFEVSANAQISGTSTFTVVPTPGSLALLGLAGIAAARRRRV